jgi:equilibrative nucleoside transporter 1/2/3
MQSYFAGLAASGALISLLRVLTKLAFEKSNNGLRKGASMFFFTILSFSRKDFDILSILSTIIFPSALEVVFFDI